jgi:hypothetical protein
MNPLKKMEMRIFTRMVRTKVILILNQMVGATAVNSMEMVGKHRRLMTKDMVFVHSFFLLLSLFLSFFLFCFRCARCATKKADNHQGS